MNYNREMSTNESTIYFGILMLLVAVVWGIQYYDSFMFHWYGGSTTLQQTTGKVLQTGNETLAMKENTIEYKYTIAGKTYLSRHYRVDSFELSSSKRDSLEPDWQGQYKSNAKVNIYYHEQSPSLGMLSNEDPDLGNKWYLIPLLIVLGFASLLSGLYLKGDDRRSWSAGPGIDRDR